MQIQRYKQQAALFSKYNILELVLKKYTDVLQQANKNKRKSRREWC